MVAGTTEIAVAKGDGIGPEIMEAVLRIFNAAGVQMKYHYVDMGKSVFDKGYSTGLTDEAMATIEETGILFKGPMETPKGKGVKSINVTARKLWNTYANVRRFRVLKGVDTIFSKAGVPVNLTILRENIEDTYGGIEYLQTPDVAVGYRMITRPGTEQFMRFAFEFARREGVKKITCGHKANIMKLTDGMFMNTFYEMAKEYPELETEDVIVDALAMKLVDKPQQYELILLPNLQGDILSDLCAGLVGGLGFAPSANVGEFISIFEAVHGTAPDIAGKGIANPTSLLLSGLLMLRHLGYISQADDIENALLVTLEQGHHTGDFGDKSMPNLNTKDYADAIIRNIGSKPTETDAVNTGTPNFNFHKMQGPEQMRVQVSNQPKTQTLMGADIFIQCEDHPDTVAQKVNAIMPGKLRLLLISNRGTQVWPESSRFTDSVAHYCLRFELANENDTIDHKEILELCENISNEFVIANIEFLRNYDGERGYSLAQGQ